MGEIVIPAKFNAHKIYKKMMFLNPYKDVGGGGTDSFNLLWKTSSPNETIEIGLGAGDFDYTIDWGDGTVESYSTSENISHIYEVSGNYTTIINGEFPSINMSSVSNNTFKNKLIDVFQWGSTKWKSINFQRAKFTVISATDIPDLSIIGALAFSFFRCDTMVSGISNWSVGNISNMVNMLAFCNSFNESLANWDITSITNFSDFMVNSQGMSNDNYDSTLISWASQAIVYSNTIDFGQSKYTLGGAAETARNTLINNYGWTIDDGGGI